MHYISSNKRSSLFPASNEHIFTTGTGIFNKVITNNTLIYEKPLANPSKYVTELLDVFVGASQLQFVNEDSQILHEVYTFQSTDCNQKLQHQN